MSVIIPTRDYARYLPDAIESVRAQTLLDWECIVVDDGSTDETPEVVARFAAHDRRISGLWQERAGPSVARNTGLARARGRYIQFLDADDRLDPDKLRHQVAILDTDHAIDVVYGPSGYFVDGDQATVRPLEDPAASPDGRLTGSAAVDLESFIMSNRLTIVGPLVRRGVFETVGGFDPHTLRMEDWEFWVRCAVADVRFRYVATRAPVAYVRVHAASVSQPVVEMMRAEVDIRRRLESLLIGHPRAQRLNTRRLDERRAELAILAALEGQTRDGLKSMAALAFRSREPRWLAWTLIIPLTAVAPIRRRLGELWRRRRSGGR